MSVADTLDALQSKALEQLRSGDHSELLVAFLTTSIMLELTKLVDPNIDLEQFASAAVDVLTQYAPIEQCTLSLHFHELPSVRVEVGMPHSSAESPTPGGIASHLTLIDVGTGFLDAHGVPSSLQDAGLVEQAAVQLTQGLGRMVEFERLRRSAASGKAFAAIAAIDGQWTTEHLFNVVSALAALPGARSASISISAARLGGPVSVVSGSTGGHRIERRIVIDERTPVEAWVQVAANHVPEHAAKVEELLDSFMSAIERSEQSIRLREEAELDDLTRLGNRRVAARVLASTRNLAENTGDSFAVLLCDLDNFKKVNDSYGHDVGDAVLQAFAAMAVAAVRMFDTVTRWGGEEFLVICPNCDEKGAVSLAERLLTGAVQACAPAFPDGHVQTVSIGIASYPHHAANPESLVRAADQALYSAKHDGRNTHRTAPYPQ
jgi:diguanylate cyclase (GGDEF)-like protein